MSRHNASRIEHCAAPPSQVPGRQPLLVCDGLHAGYGKKAVLRGISLTADKGGITAIIGPNGAGKSTLLKVIAGFLRPGRGSVLLDGRDVTGLAPHQRARAGIAYFMQGGRVFPSLTVAENLAMAAAASRGATARVETKRVLDVFPKLEEMLVRRAGLLSGGERQTLALAMALVRRPTVLLLDEPSAGLSPLLVREMLDKVREAAQTSGSAVLMVEQNVTEALKVADKAIALSAGQVAITTEDAQRWLDGDELEMLFLGGNRTLTVGHGGTIGTKGVVR